MISVKKEAETQKFYIQYAEHLKLNQTNGFCYKCWNEIIEKNGTWLDICVKESVKHFLIDMNNDSFKKEYEGIYISSKENK